MKSKTDDRRLWNSNERYVASRAPIVEALEAQGREGLAYDELFTLIGGEMNGETDQNRKQSLSRLLTGLYEEGHVAEYRGRLYLTPNLPQNGAKAALNGVLSNAGTEPQVNGHNNGVRTFQSNQEFFDVEVFTSPHLYQDCGSVKLLIGGQWFPVMLGGRMRVCYGQGIPEWANKATYTNVETIKLVLKGGKAEELHPAPRDMVTVALVK
jgi:hypothetical protein